MATTIGKSGNLCRNIYQFHKLIDTSVVYANILSVKLQQRQFSFYVALPSQKRLFYDDKPTPTIFKPTLAGNSLQHLLIKGYSKKVAIKPSKDKTDEKLSLFQRFKQMYKEYWYVLVPVHLVTSAAWFGGFYYLAKSGVDIITLLESLHISEKIINPLRDSSMGYVAVAYALYKVSTPARYTVTLGGTTISINYLKKWGYIKPVPTAEQLKEIYMEKRDNLMETMRETKEDLIHKADKIKDQKDNIIEDLEKGIKKFKATSAESIKNKKNDIVDNINKTLQKDTSK